MILLDVNPSTDSDRGIFVDDDERFDVFNEQSDSDTDDDLIHNFEDDNQAFDETLNAKTEDDQCNDIFEDFDDEIIDTKDSGLEHDLILNRSETLSSGSSENSQVCIYIYICIYMLWPKLVYSLIQNSSSRN